MYTLQIDVHGNSMSAVAWLAPASMPAFVVGAIGAAWLAGRDAGRGDRDNG